MSGSSVQEEFVHSAETGARSISGSYDIEKESLLKIDEKEILCLIGHGVVDSSCCGVGGCRFAYVPGAVLEYHARRNEKGEWISLVEPVKDPEVQTRIRRTLEETEMVQQVNFK